PSYIFFLNYNPVDFRNPLAFRRLSAKPPRRKRLWGLGQPVIRQECRKFLPSIKDYRKKHEE
ncbi:hypothetical protein, partial [Peribacillus frigoritolerans]|uniref:hypothetical protein n=1 Tax=Peribacillus frigoritolerans TaxID=450367 RepID=UPI001E5C369B